MLKHNLQFSRLSFFFRGQNDKSLALQLAL
jgi:hypothetical protein